jgi:hypothetical protein
MAVGDDVGLLGPELVWDPAGQVNPARNRVYVSPCDRPLIDLRVHFYLRGLRN